MEGCVTGRTGRSGSSAPNGLKFEACALVLAQDRIRSDNGGSSEDSFIGVCKQQNRRGLE